MLKPKKLTIVALFFFGFTASAADVENRGAVLAIGKASGDVCRIKIEGANFAGACNTAIYQEAYFPCAQKDTLSIGLSAYLVGKPVRITSDACSVYGSSVANVTGIHLE